VEKWYIPFPGGLLAPYLAQQLRLSFDILDFKNRIDLLKKMIVY
jgi:hypothetical protein